MSEPQSPFAVDEALERAYRLALGLHALVGDRMPASGDPVATDLSLWAMASELLCVLDDARARRVQQAMSGAAPRAASA